MSREMKDSGVKWIGAIPHNWHLEKVKWLFEIGRGRVIPITDMDELNNYPVYSSQTKNNGIMGYVDTFDFDRRQLTWTTDGANAGTVFIREGKHNCTNVCGTLYPKMQNHDLLFQKYALEYIAIFHKRADTNGYKIMNNEMADIFIPIPSFVVQRKIAMFLNNQVIHIESLIEKTKTTIKDYKLLKQSIITEAVTKGLDKNVEMRDSGIEWVESMPAHWDILRGKVILNKLSRPVIKSDTVITCFRDGEVTLRSNRREDGFTMADKEIGYQGVEPGDLVVHGMDGFAGAIGVSDSRGKSTPVLNVLDSNQNKEYIMFYLRSMAISDVFLALATGIRVRSCDLRWSKIGDLPYPIPPIEEQRKIVEYIKNKLQQISVLVEKKQNLLEELESYKKSLIYEYVTGKKEVI